MAYFIIMAELRGCYADNESAQLIRCDTRRDLKAALEGEAYYLRDAGAVGLSKRAVASLAAQAWANRTSRGRSSFPVVQGFRYAHQSSDCMGLMVYNATRADYLAAQAEHDA